MERQEGADEQNTLKRAVAKPVCLLFKLLTLFCFVFF
jgi:hypothetical protein